MKLRQGFVSNSSTTSFCIYGAYFSDDSKLKDKNFNNFDCYYEPYESGVYLGISWPSIKDDETGAQFKQRVKDEFEKSGFEDVELSTHEAGWYDG